MTIRPPAFLANFSHRSPARSDPKSESGSFAVEVDGREVVVAVRRNPRARRYVLRLDVRGDGAVLTLPSRAPLAAARAFLDRQLPWLADRLANRPPPEVCPCEVPLRGVVVPVVPSGAIRGLVRLESDADGATRLVVPGEAAHLRRRLTDHLRKLARADLEQAVGRHAAALGVRPMAIHIRDTTSRWGSASPSGALSFSWRLVMAPPFVLDYVAAHEVAHLREMNHSSRFWEICLRLAPRGHEARAWLNANGSDLHRRP